MDRHAGILRQADLSINGKIKQTAVVTGASAGIGKAAAKALLQKGWRVIGVGRDPARCAGAEQELASANFTMLRADMALLSDTARLADEIASIAPHIDVLLCNAGGVRNALYVSDEGHEATFATNHLAHFLLTRKLHPQLKAAGHARVITTSSDAHEYCPAMNWDDLNHAADYSIGAAYCQAKLANVLFTRELAKRGSANGIIASAIHPGPVTSNFWSHGDESFQTRIDQIRDQAVTPEQAAEVAVRLACMPYVGTVNGQYYYKGDARDPSAAAMDEAAAQRLWELSEEIVSAYC